MMGSSKGKIGSPGVCFHFPGSRHPYLGNSSPGSLPSRGCILGTSYLIEESLSSPHLWRIIYLN